MQEEWDVQVRMDRSIKRSIKERTMGKRYRRGKMGGEERRREDRL